MNIKRSSPRKAISGPSRDATLGQDAKRLLAALEAEGAYAFEDPIDSDGLILRGVGSGVSLGGGRFGAAAGTALLKAGLVERSDDKRRHLVISGAGRARLRRMRWPAETAFRAQHLELVEEPETAGVPRALHDLSESPLTWMASRRGRDGRPLIDPAAFEAGERLRSDLTLAAMLPRIGTDWARPHVDGGGGGDPAAGSDTRLAAKIRVDLALKAVGADLAGLLIDLCGFLKGLERIESERHWPPRSGKVVVRIALARLAEHYGIEGEAVGPERARPRLWRA